MWTMTPHFRKTPTLALLKKKAAQFRATDSEEALALLLHTDSNKLRLITLNLRYKVFEIRKKNGKFRVIEDPEKSLKSVLRWLNHYLQAVYYFQRPGAAYGFCISTRDEAERNVITNASRHLGNPYVLNIDLRDFFHSINTELVQRIFIDHFTSFREPVINLLTSLSTFRGRLPMGSPASPVLSNMASLEMDAELEGFCKGASITYTRYVDDMTFSSKDAISDSDQHMLKDIIHHHHFMVNKEKVRYYKEDETPSVTGLVLGKDAVELPQHYLPTLEKEIGRLQNVMLVEMRYRLGVSNKRLTLLKQEIMGKLNFARMALGSEHTDVARLYNQFEEVQFAQSDFESTDWLEIPYGIEP